MKKKIVGGVIVLINILLLQTLQAQGTMTYLSNLGQTPADSLAVGSDSSYAALFITGTNSSGYTLDSIQLGMANASGNPSNFTVMLYSSIITGAILPGSSLGTLDGSLNPVLNGTYAYIPASNLLLSPDTIYFIVLTAGTTIANDAFDWSYVGTYAYSQNGGWRTFANILNSSNGSSWTSIPSTDAQFAINATAIPEPGVLGMFGLGGMAFLWHRRKVR